MCLIKVGKKQVAETDILVYKCLDYDTFIEKYVTSFQYFPVEFIDGISCLSIKRTCFNTRGKYINYGIHGYYKKSSADKTSLEFEDCGTKTHYAIIHKGTPYCLGMEGDIVTTKMTIFETEEDYEKYKSNSDVEIKEIE